MTQATQFTVHGLQFTLRSPFTVYNVAHRKLKTENLLKTENGKLKTTSGGSI